MLFINTFVRIEPKGLGRVLSYSGPAHAIVLLPTGDEERIPLTLLTPVDAALLSWPERLPFYTVR